MDLLHSLSSLLSVRVSASYISTEKTPVCNRFNFADIFIFSSFQGIPILPNAPEASWILLLTTAYCPLYVNRTPLFLISPCWYVIHIVCFLHVQAHSYSCKRSSPRSIKSMYPRITNCSFASPLPLFISLWCCPEFPLSVQAPAETAPWDNGSPCLFLTFFRNQFSKQTLPDTPQKAKTQSFVPDWVEFLGIIHETIVR